MSTLARFKILTKILAIVIVMASTMIGLSWLGITRWRGSTTMRPT